MPGGPSTTTTPPRPCASDPTNSRATSSSFSRPRIGGVTRRRRSALRAVTRALQAAPKVAVEVPIARCLGGPLELRLKVDGVQFRVLRLIFESAIGQYG